jgi:hypothetical protein
MKKLIVSLFAIVVLSLGIGLYYFYKQPPDIRESISDFEVTAAELMENYSDEMRGNELYLGHVITVTGRVANLENENGNLTVFLETGDPLTGITCSLYPDEIASFQSLQVGKEVRVKGECTGKLTDIILTHCSIVN